MRKLLLPAVAIVSLVLACENKTPSGPGEVTITETTTSTSTTTTTTTVPPGPTTVSTTTTSVVGATQRRYITTGGAANVPFDMQLIYQLIGGALTAPSFIERLPLIGEAFATATEIRYKVTGTYVTPSGATGSVEGDLFGPSDPLQNGGEFHGVLRTTVGTCTAERVFRGPMGPVSMSLLGGEMVSDCPEHPLAFNAVSMTQSNSPPPPPTTTTTVAASCVLTVSPTSVQVPDTATTSPISIQASAPTCNWTAQALAPWLTVSPPAGAGSIAVQVAAAANTNGPARVGTLLIAGQVVTVNQTAPTPPDLVPTPHSVSSSGALYCDRDPTLGSVVRSFTRNVGLGPATVESFTTLFLNSTQQTLSQRVPPLDRNQELPVTFQLPSACFASGGCAFRLTVDGTNIVYEGATGADTNNFVDGTCFGYLPPGGGK